MRTLAFTLLLTIGPVLAEAQARQPSAADLQLDLPDVSHAPTADTVHDGYKTFFFFREGVSAKEANEDLSFCTQLTRTGAFLLLPGFVPWGDATARPVAKDQGRFGLVGDAAAHFLVPALTRGTYIIKMRRCMEPRGYTRYPMSRAAWDTIHGANFARSIAQQAALASGPKPSYAEAAQ